MTRSDAYRILDGEIEASNTLDPNFTGRVTPKSSALECLHCGGDGFADCLCGGKAWCPMCNGTGLTYCNRCEAGISRRETA